MRAAASWYRKAADQGHATAQGNLGLFYEQGRGDHGVQDPRPDPVEPNPKQPIGGQEMKATFALPPQDADLMSKSDELKF
jgi:TPR repeat protein